MINVARIAAAKLYKVIDRASLISSAVDDGETLDELKGKIDFVNVDFSYPSRADTLVFEVCVLA